MLNMKRMTHQSEDAYQAEKLFLTAFPKEEQVPFEALMEDVAAGNAELWGFYREDEFCGSVYAIVKYDVTIIFYLAVEPALRSKHYGSEILQQMHDVYQDNSIILFIEPLRQGAANYQQRVRRKDFYVRNGFECTEYELFIDKVGYELLIKGGNLSEKRTVFLEAFQQFCGDDVPLKLCPLDRT